MTPTIYSSISWIIGFCPGPGECLAWLNMAAPGAPWSQLKYALQNLLKLWILELQANSKNHVKATDLAILTWSYWLLVLSCTGIALIALFEDWLHKNKIFRHGVGNIIAKAWI
jgi:hypothetical protein